MYANILLLTVLNNVKFNLSLFCFLVPGTYMSVACATLAIS